MTKPTKEKFISVTVRFTVPDYVAVSEIARAEERSVNYTINNMVRKYLKKEAR